VLDGFGMFAISCADGTAAVISLISAPLCAGSRNGRDKNLLSASLSSPTLPNWDHLLGETTQRIEWLFDSGFLVTLKPDSTLTPIATRNIWRHF
jgi:hypothetical protein